MSTTRGREYPDTVPYPDGFKAYGELVSYGDEKNRVKHGENEFVDAHGHIYGIQKFMGHLQN